MPRGSKAGGKRIKIDMPIYIAATQLQPTIKRTNPFGSHFDSFARLSVPFDKFLIKFAFNGETNVVPDKGRILVRPSLARAK